MSDSIQSDHQPLFYEFKTGDKAHPLRYLALAHLNPKRPFDPKKPFVLDSSKKNPPQKTNTPKTSELDVDRKSNGKDKLSVSGPLRGERKSNGLLGSSGLVGNGLSGWVFYVNDRRRDSLEQTIRPRSKILMVSKDSPLPEIEIAHETKELIILNKPAGLATQKTLKSFEDNLYDRIRLWMLISKNFPPGLPYVGLHHRLDKMTSGLVLMTKQRSANKLVADLFQHKKIQKDYLAYVAPGKEQPPKKWQDKSPIGRVSHKKHPFYFGVTKDGDSAVSDFELLESREGLWHKLQCSPKTGRTHQLRVHLKNKGFPILGDPVYGNKKSAGRLMLHAWKLQFEFRGQNVSVEAEPTWTVPEPQA